MHFLLDEAPPIEEEKFFLVQAKKKLDLPGCVGVVRCEKPWCCVRLTRCVAGGRAGAARASCQNSLSVTKWFQSELSNREQG